MLTNKQESTGSKQLNNYKANFEFLNDLNDIYKNIAGCNTNKNCKILIVSNYVIADMLSHKNLNPIVTELFFKGEKVFFFCFYYKPYSAVPKMLD